MHASLNLTGLRERELSERVAMQDVQMQRMMDEEAQATVAFAATQRELQRMADEEAHAAMAVGRLQHETARKAGLLGEQAREVCQNASTRVCHAWSPTRRVSRTAAGFPCRFSTHAWRFC